jgi:hypothetical protein
MFTEHFHLLYEPSVFKVIHTDVSCLDRLNMFQGKDTAVCKDLSLSELETVSYK